jgi:hypothetical protein
MTQYNNFIFTGTTIEGLWSIDCSIPLKNKYIVEFVRCVVSWVFWLESNKLCFTTHSAKTDAMLGFQIIDLTKK